MGHLVAYGENEPVGIRHIDSILVAVCAPNAKTTLEHIDDLRKATSGSPTELAAAKSQKEADRHAEIWEIIERT